MSIFYKQKVLVTRCVQEQAVCPTDRCERTLFLPEVFARNFVATCQSAVVDRLF